MNKTPAGNPKLILGNRIKVPHGTGTVIGFERFFEGKTALKSDIQSTSGEERTILSLDSGHSWPFEGNYAAFPKDILEVLQS